MGQWKTYIKDFSQRLDAARAQYVQLKEKDIKFGSDGDGPWHDVEADEVDLNNELVLDSDT